MTLLGAQAAGEFTTPSSKDHYAPDWRLEPVHLDLQLRVDLEGKRLDAAIAHRIRANDEGAQALTLHGEDFEGLAVEGASFDYDGKAIALRWEEPFAKGEEREVVLRYRVVNPVSGLMFHGPSADDPDAPVFVATDHETERARHWLATVDHPNVRPTLRFAIRADAKQVILANGAHRGETAHDDGTKTVVWELEQPCPSYLTCFAVGDFVRWDGETVDGVPVAAFAPKTHDEGHLERSFGRTADMLRWLPELLGTPYPYPKYFQIALPFIGGAMENISLVTWDDRFLLDASLERDERELLDIINVHEMAHTWFGDLIVCRDFAHVWLKESWATFIETCWLEHDLGRDARDFELWRKREAYVKEATERYSRPIVTRRFDSSWDMFDYHLYPGGAWRLHMLREQLGDDVFWTAVRDYVARYAGKKVETDDFRRVLEEHGGRELGRFFDQWLRSPGFPQLEGHFSWDPACKEGTFVLKQTQVDDKKGIPCFAFELDLAWTVHGQEEVRTVRFEEERLRMTFPMEAAPTMVRVDPGLKVLHTLKKFDAGDRRWRAQLKASDVVGRIQAGGALAQSGKRANIEALVKAFADEPFWGVREAWAEALGQSNGEAAIEAIGHLMETEEEPRVLTALAKAAGQTRDQRLRSAILSALDRDPSPRTAEALLESLGKQGELADLDRLREAAGTKTYAMAAEAGALRGLGALREGAAVDALVQLVQPGASSRLARANAAMALGHLSRRVNEPLQEQIREALIERLRDPNLRVRRAAASALVAARATGARAALERFRATLPFQEQMRLDRELRRLERGDGSLKRAEERIEKLERSLRQLTDRLERLEARQPG